MVRRRTRRCISGRSANAASRRRLRAPSARPSPPRRRSTQQFGRSSTSPLWSGLALSQLARASGGVSSGAVAMAPIVAGGPGTVAAGGGAPFAARMVPQEVQHAAGAATGPQLRAVGAREQLDGLTGDSGEGSGHRRPDGGRVPDEPPVQEGQPGVGGQTATSELISPTATSMSSTSGRGETWCRRCTARQDVAAHHAAAEHGRRRLW